MLILLSMCIGNLVIDYQETREEPEFLNASVWAIIQETLKRYWIALVVAFIVFLVSKCTINIEI